MSASSPPLLEPDQALQHLLAAARLMGETEQLPVAGALGRVLAQEVRSAMDVPLRCPTQTVFVACQRNSFLLCSASMLILFLREKTRASI